MFLPFRGNSEVRFKPLCRTVCVYGEITFSEPCPKYKYLFNFNRKARIGFKKEKYLMIYVYKTHL